MKYESIFRVVTLVAFLACSTVLTSCPASNGTGKAQQANSSGSTPKVDEFLQHYSDEDRAIIENSERIRDELKVILDISEDMARSHVETILEEARFKPEQAAVLTGSPIEWKELRSWPERPLSGMFGIHTGNFDDNPGEEILFMDNGFSIVYPDGSEGAKLGSLISTPEYVWDFGGDGKDDFVGGAFGPIIAFDFAGKTLVKLEGTPSGPHILTGDFDGDGNEELFMAATTDYGSGGPMAGFNHLGKKYFELDSSWNTPYTISGDVDGDGKDEIIRLDPSLGWCAGGLDQEATTLNLPEAAAKLSPAICADLNGDGCDELIGTEGIVLDLVSGSSFQLELPAGWKSLHMDGTFQEALAFLPGENPKIVAIPSRAGTRGDAICSWDLSGKLIYLEHFGELALRMLVLTDASGRKQVVVATSTRLLISPAAAAGPAN